MKIIVAVPIVYWLVPCTICSLVVTLGVDYLLRDEWLEEFFWRHGWHTPILVLIEFVLCFVLARFIWRCGDEGNPRMFLEWDLIWFLAVSIVCTSWVFWQLWQISNNQKF
jgi:hypothetical protein